ncbi:aminoglycoside 6'-N-acetyltransferase [Fictibacillus phosphorivorans]|uniref:aminoglycoside 6'-N-acetyltransferase n=1 Tax=Fictibacillus phosphorivorans TaxID=1221500 RepID=UPI0012937D4B|nr:aminoglycoside 6'-N-acetyltransferase [Fictibacillus phosphorivorans]MQR96282.1 GNAT family N-acetyltransferase [Fictibacillus phosphorivorans]
MESIKEASEQYLDSLTSMALALWPDNEANELRREFKELITSEKNKVLLYFMHAKPIAFIHISVRSDYVEGSHNSPTGFIEGVYVEPEYRKKGISKKLIEVGERWLRTKDCTQIGSDIELSNNTSYQFHKSVGFKEVNRLIAFIKNIDEA